MRLNTKRGGRNVSSCGIKAILPEKPLFTAVAGKTFADKQQLKKCFICLPLLKLLHIEEC